MKKIGIIASVVALGAIGAYALVPALFPNTPAFPRVPVGSGTIGEMIGRLVGTNDLANYFGDGTVENTESLSWVSSTGYLQSITCPGTNIWKWIDANGKALCGPRVPMLTDYGRVSDQKCPATIYKTDGSTVMSSSGYILKWGDVVQTPVGCDLTIAFSDLSTLHLDEDTTVSLDMGSFPNNTTIATAILESGQIWGRILTETGVYNVGTHSIVAAVRGTSISLSMTGWMNSTPSYDTNLKRWIFSPGLNPNGTKLSIVDSTMPISSAKLHCEVGTGIRDIYNTDMKPGDTYDLPSGFPTRCTSSVKTTPISDLYTENRWIANNTLTDLWNMQKILKTMNLSASKTTKIMNEFDTSLPNTPWEKTNICTTGKIFWESLGETTLGIEKCQSIKTIGMVNFTEYYKPGSSRILSPLRGAITTLSNANVHGNLGDILTSSGLLIDNSWEWVDYDFGSNFPGLTLNGKKIEIQLAGPMMTGGNRYLLDLWWSSNIQFYKNSSDNWVCVIHGTSSPGTSTECSATNNWNKITLIEDPLTHLITITMPNAPIPTDFYIGLKNNTTNPLMGTIRSVNILQNP